MANENTQQDAKTGTDIVLSNPDNVVSFEPDDLRSIASFQDAMRLVEDTLGGTVVDASEEIGDGFTMLDDKDKLINVPFIALQWRFTPGDFGKQYVIMRVVTDTGDKYVITDGGTGIAQQMASFTERTKRTGGLLVKRGLRKSEYDNEFGHGTTHYLNV